MNKPEAKEPIRCSHILVKHTGSRNPISRRTNQPVTFSKQQALDKLHEIQKRVNTSNFMQIAHEESDCGSYVDGGDLGVFGRGDMQAPFEAAAYVLPVNAISDIVETESGLHLIMRLDIPKQIRCSHILIKHAGSRNPVSRRTGQPTTIARAEAVQRLEKIRKTLTTSNFSEQAKEHSDCGSFKNGGDLGLFGMGEMQQPFEEVAFKLAVGQISQVVDTDSGVHLILRLE
jgi:parvulin-like peptidyl-prolyl isomerase